MADSDSDRAIVVGIRRYFGFTDLDGPENDARAFRDWLISPMGGAVPLAQVRLILSSDYHPPDPANPTFGKPTPALVQEAFDQLLYLAEMSSENGTGFRLGRRLYIYLAGHGFEPQPEVTALLTANATRMRGYHVAGRIVADYFRRAGIFDEVVLFMDCCRENGFQTPLNVPPYVYLASDQAPERGRWLVGFATKWSRLSREKKIGNQSRGVFTVALLTGLQGAAAEQNGEITAESLSRYLYEHMKDFLSDAELQDPDIPKQPDMDYDKNPANRLVIARVAQPQYSVKIDVSATASQGGKLVIFDGKFSEVFYSSLTEMPVVTTLLPGFYLAQILPGGARQAFTVPGQGQGGTAHVVL